MDTCKALAAICAFSCTAGIHNSGSHRRTSESFPEASESAGRRTAQDSPRFARQHGPSLAALKISISFLQAACPLDSSALAAVSDVASLADRAIEEIRTMSYLLHPPLLDEVGFNCAAEWFIEGFAKRSGINVKLQIEPIRDRLPMRIEIVLFRVLQESLTNVHRHSGASEVSVCFRNACPTS